MAQTYPALADRLTRETAWRVVTGTLRGVGESGGDFSRPGWLDDLALSSRPRSLPRAPRWLVGFGFGGVLALHLAAQDERVAGVACLGTPADLATLTDDPEALLERCVAPASSDARVPSHTRRLGQGILDLPPAEDVELLKGRPLLVVHGADDPDVPCDDARALAAAATGPSELRWSSGRGTGSGPTPG